jgi:hypothetical protein|nr:hypothetical protein [Panacagrimonas sp.]
MLVRSAFLSTDVSVSDPTIAQTGCAELRCATCSGTVAQGFRTRCAHCGRLQRLPKPVLRGWTCAACVARELSPR